MFRESVVSGQFYPASAAAIKEQIESFLPSGKINKSKALAVIMPHAGYVYSGNVAVSVAASVEIPKNVIILGPNHTGFGPSVSIMLSGTWNTPLGNVDVEEKIARALINNSKHFSSDQLAHTHEHCIEVELPILQYFRKDFKFVPIILKPVSLREIFEIGETIVKVIKMMKLEGDVLLIASSDMTHYESNTQAERKDAIAIEQIIKLDAKGLLEAVKSNDISMCGVYPSVVVLDAARRLGAKQAKLVKYETSAKASGDQSQVVGYAGLIIE